MHKQTVGNLWPCCLRSLTTHTQRDKDKTIRNYSITFIGCRGRYALKLFIGPYQDPVQQQSNQERVSTIKLSDTSLAGTEKHIALFLWLERATVATIYHASDIRPYFSFGRLEVSAVIPSILYRKRSEDKQYKSLCCKYLGVVSNIKKQVWFCWFWNFSC